MVNRKNINKRKTFYNIYNKLCFKMINYNLFKNIE